MIDDPKSEDRTFPDRLAAIRHELQALYRDVDRALEQHAPVCELSGRCCRFQEYGHTLFLSEPEARLLLADAPPPVRALDDEQTCPWQDMKGRCTARAARPLGCRIFFCDPAFLEHAPTVSETFLSRLKQLADRFDWPWNYAPLHSHLRTAQTEGRWQVEVLRPVSTLDDDHRP